MTFGTYLGFVHDRLLCEPFLWVPKEKDLPRPVVCEVTETWICAAGIDES